MSYIIGAGWWCDGTGKYNPGLNKSTDRTRSTDMFDTWYEKISKFTSPEKIVVVDSASPVKPDFESRKDIVVVPLLDNYNSRPHMTRHSVAYRDTVGVHLHRSAATRQVFLSAAYAVHNSVDYYVWIEQDCLIQGNVIERAIEEMEKTGSDLSMGQFLKRAWRETSFFVVRAMAIHKLWELFAANKATRPEQRYWYASQHMPFCPLPFGYGRNRPINWDDEFIFAQHLTDEELDKFRSM